MGELGAGGAGGLGNGAGAEILDGVEGVAAALKKHADTVDDVVGALDGAVDGLAIAQVRLDVGDLANAADRLQEAGKIRAAHGDADAVAAARQRAHHMTPDEARAAEDGDERRKVGQGHVAAPGQ